jgi:hypothetical protein
MNQIDRMLGGRTRLSRLSESEGPTTADCSPAKKLEKQYKQWLLSGNIFKPVGEVKLVDSLPAAAYQVQQSFDGVQFEHVVPKTDHLLIFEKSSMHQVVEEIDKFWARKDAYDALGLMHNRGILLYGPPGTGKSICLQQVSEMMVKRGDLVFFTKSPSAIAEALKILRQVEETRRVVVAFEEADELARYDESTLLRLMDGDMKLDQILFLATTNYIDRLPPRMLRPGRFDKKVYVSPPTLEQREYYLTAKAGKVASAEQIKEMARKTDGLSFGHLRELVAGVFAIGDPLPEVLARLRALPIRESGHFDYDYANDKDGKVKPLRESRSTKVKPAVDRLLG